jgi:hypothetical protein
MAVFSVLRARKPVKLSLEFRSLGILRNYPDQKLLFSVRCFVTYFARISARRVDHPNFLLRGEALLHDRLIGVRRACARSGGRVLAAGTNHSGEDTDTKQYDARDKHVELGHPEGNERPSHTTEEDCKPDEIKREGHGKVSLLCQFGGIAAYQPVGYLYYHILLANNQCEHQSFCIS